MSQTDTSIKKTVRTYRLSMETVTQIDQLAQRHEVGQSEIVDLLLQRALDEIQANRWKINREPVKYRVKF